ncbi:MAG: DDE-type integrase/transposase/recombinase [Gammaproteobacteria bacterium]|nr:DDE-type integrase/transposase/recombinase [Gammaproteobacteria bacterium]
MLDIPFAAHNDDYHFLLVVICLFSKYVWVRALRSKHGLVVAEALEDVFNSAKAMENHRVCEMLQTDAGKEFYNQHMRQLLERYRVRHLSVNNPDVKAMVVERVNRTLRDRIYRYMTKKNTYSYLPVLEKLVDGYNRAWHSKIKMAPVDVTLENWKDVYLNVYRPERVSSDAGGGRKTAFRVGDTVVIQKKKDLFEKGSSYNWTDEYFLVSKVVRGNPNYYYIKDTLGEEFTGQKFYARDLQLVRPNLDTWMRIEKVLKRRRVGRVDEEQLVKWLGWPSKFNSWVRAADMYAV